jgi:predicted MPP superfamily phosphohydrolase
VFNTLSLLQVGDIHLPDNKAKPLVDLKDKSFPDSIVQLAAPRPLQNVLRELKRQSNKADAILLCGDLTSRGDIPSYEQCVEYLIRVLDLNNRPTETLHAVPGNHDVNRNLADKVDIFAKFKPLELAWAKHSLPILAVSAFRSTVVSSKSNCKAQIYSLNSCVGSGEIKHLPLAIRTQLAELLEKHTEDVGEDNSFELIGETLDTPAFMLEDIDTICESIGSLDDRTAPIVMAHHNLLPQALVRIELYTEAINSGLVRSRLAREPRPVIYLHGHIHDDPVESISALDMDSAPLTVISAPEIIKGFNLIHIHYGRGRYPIGCTITPFRMQRDAAVVPGRLIRVPFYGPGRAPRKLRDAPLLRHLKYLSSTFEHFTDVLAKVRQGINKNIREMTLAGYLYEAEWLGLAAIVDRDESPRLWQVRKTFQ